MAATSRLRSLAALFAVSVAALALSGCSATRQLVNQQGYISDPQLVSAVQPGVDNKESVAKALGDPTFVAQWDGNVWYYVSRDTKQRSFARPRPKDEKVLIVKFDKAGNVTAVEHRGMEQVANITPNGDKTPALGRRQSILEDIFGNIGQVGPGMGGGTGGGAPGQ